MNESDVDHIARRAYALWEQEGRPDGRHEEHWRQALTEFQETQPAVAADMTEAVPPALMPVDSPDIAPDTLSQDDKPVAPRMRSVR